MMQDRGKSLAEMQADEARRVAALIERDREAARRDRERANARAELANGSFASLDKTALEPTPEWLAKGETMPFTPKQLDGTVRTVRTVRRVALPWVLKMHRAGNLTDDQLAACLWYRSQFEEAGLQGRVKCSHISLTGNTGGEGGGMGQSPMPLHAREAEARSNYRGAKAAIDQRYVQFFERVVLDDMPIKRSSAYMRSRTMMQKNIFRSCCEQVIVFMEKSGLEYRSVEGEGEKNV